MINSNGWVNYSIWEHSSIIKELYTRRCKLEEEEMTCHAQAAEILAPCVTPGDILLDIGCGSGYFFHSLKKHSIPVEYYGIDAAPSLIEIGQINMAAFGLTPQNLRLMRIEDLDGSVDHVVCMNVLTYIDNYYRPLERMLRCAKKTVILRESLGKACNYLYVQDKYLDQGYRLKTHINTYLIDDMLAFINSYGFNSRVETDWRTQGNPETSIDYPVYWTFIIAEKK